MDVSFSYETLNSWQEATADSILMSTTAIPYDVRSTIGYHNNRWDSCFRPTCWNL